MNQAEVRELISQGDNSYYEKEEQFKDKDNHPKKKNIRRRRDKPEWKR